MFENSIIAKTGQMWKLLLGILVVGGGAVIMFWGIASLSRTEGFAPVPFIFSGMLLVVIGFGFIALAVRCPRCGARWCLRSMSQKDAGIWFAWLMAQTNCPWCTEESNAQPGSGAA